MENLGLRRAPLAFTIFGFLMTVAWTGSPSFPDQRTISPAAFPPAARALHSRHDLGRLAVNFFPNYGQLDERVEFYIEGKNQAIYFSKNGVTFALQSFRPDRRNDRKNEILNAPAWPESSSSHRLVEGARWIVKVDFLDANPGVEPRGEGETGMRLSYFRGGPESWKTDLPAYARIVYPDLWPGIDLVYSGATGELKSEFIVHPGSDPSRIRLAYRGADSVVVDEAGRLIASTPEGTLVEAPPVAYQEISGKRLAIPSAHRIVGRSEASSAQENIQEGTGGSTICGFRVAEYNRNEPLILDPVILTSCGYIGGPDLDYSYGIAVDPAGHIFITGYTYSVSSFPVSAGPDLSFNGGDADAFVAKVNASGTAIEYCGYIGGSGNDYGYGIAIDRAGNAYVTGYTSSNELSFPVRKGPDLSHNGRLDVFVAKVKADGSALEYCGYIGGSDDDFGRGIAVDAAGNAYLAGSTYSSQSSFPVAVGPQLIYGGNRDAFVAAVAASGNDLLYCGYVGGSGEDIASGVALDGEGNAYIVGSTNSPTNALPAFPATIGPDLEPGGLFDAFAAKIAAGGTALVYCGYIGGSGDDFGSGIAVDTEGNAYITGTTSSTEDSFPVLLGPDLNYNGGPSDAFTARIWKDGSFLVHCGYIGGSEYDSGTGIAVDGYGFVYVTGYTSSAEDSFPVKEGPALALSGSFDVFVAKVRRIANNLDFCGYLGGADADLGTGIALDQTGSGKIYLTGHTYSTELSFPVAIGPDLTHNGRRDGFVAKIQEQAITLVSPNGFETWYAGLEEDIRWLTWGEVGEVTIEYSTDKGENWVVIAEATENDGRFTWLIPETASTECLVRISGAEEGIPSDTSDAVFAISDAPVIFILSPNGGEAWAVGSEQDIVWRSARVANVKIDYTYDGGTTWEGISDVTENNGVFRWVIPDTVSDQCRVRVSDLDSVASDVSDSFFSIIEAASSTENKQEIRRTIKQKAIKKNSPTPPGDGGLR